MPEKTKHYTKISDLYNINRTYDSRMLGIEVEVEFNKTYSIPLLPNWTTIDDGSLRGFSKEFITKPIPFTKVMPAVSELFDFLEGKTTDGGKEKRASIHVHVDQSAKTVRQLVSNLMAYYLIEPFVFDAVCPGRRGNLFCQPLSTSSMNVKYFINALKQGGGGGQKYCAVNFNRLFDLGTLEFRMYPGEYNKRPLRAWVAFLHNLSEKTLDTTPKQLYDTLWNDGIETFLDMVMTPTCPYRNRIIANYDKSRVPFLEVSALSTTFDWHEAAFVRKQPPTDVLTKYALI